MRFLAFVGLAAALAALGCASPTRQTDAFLASGHPSLPLSSRIEGVPFVQQEVGHCGPATLTMAMNWAGHQISVQELAPQVFTPGMKGSLQLDMISASRRNGLVAVPISGIEALFKEISSGHPVIIFENLALSWAPTWHYAIVFGYDLQKKVVLMHSGPEAFKEWDLRTFERSWMLGDYWGLVVLPPNQLSATAGEREHLNAAMALEQVGKTKEASIAYETLLKRWPQNLGSLIGLGNWYFQQKNYLKAVQSLQQATRFHSSSAAAWHNLAIAESSAGLSKRAQRSAQRALSLATGSSQRAYQKSLKNLLTTSPQSVLFLESRSGPDPLD